MKIWTFEYNVFRLGGSPHCAVAVDVELTDRVELPHGFEGYAVKNPIQKLWHVVESVSGGIIATKLTRDAAIAAASEDIAAGLPEAMRGQVEVMSGFRDCATIIEETRFWTLLDKNVPAPGPPAIPT